MKDNLISVIMVTYNSENFVEEAIKSVLNQSYNNLEVIIIDDGSTDNTISILNKFISGRNVRILTFEHTGNVGKHRNYAISLAKGQYITFLDSDDVWIKNKIEIQINYLKKYQFICSNAYVIGENSEMISGRYFDKFNNNFTIDLKDLIFNNFVITSTVMLDKGVIQKSTPFDESVGIRGEDYIFWLNIIEQHKGFFINEPLISYRRHLNNLSFKTNDERIELLKRTINIREKYFQHIDLDVQFNSRKGCTDLFTQLMKLYYHKNEYIESKYYCKKTIKQLDNKLSFIYFRYLLYYCYLSFLSFFIKFKL